MEGVFSFLSLILGLDFIAGHIDGILALPFPAIAFAVASHCSSDFGDHFACFQKSKGEGFILLLNVHADLHIFSLFVLIFGCDDDCHAHRILGEGQENQGQQKEVDFHSYYQSDTLQTLSVNRSQILKPKSFRGRWK